MCINTITSKDKKQEENTYKIEIQPLKGFELPKGHLAKYTEAGDFLSVRYTERKVLCHAKRISATQYKNMRTGEIRDCVPLTNDEKKQIRKRTLRRTFDNLRAIIRENFSAEGKNQLFITLTFDNQTTNPKEVFTKFDRFMKRLKDKYKGIHKFECVSVVEPHESGAWHIHLLLLSVDADMLYIADADFRAVWRNGITSTQRLKSDDVGNYYCAYFTGLISGSEHDKEEREFLEIEHDILC